MASAPSAAVKVQDDFPHEVKAQMKQFQDLLGQLKTALMPLVEGKVPGEAVDQRDDRTKLPLTTACSDLTRCYAVNSLYWGELC